MAIAQLAQVFYEPSAAFAALKERPRAWLPLLLLWASTIGIIVWYFQTVDMDWLVAHTLPPEATDEARAAAAKMMGRGSMMGFGIGGVVIGTAVIFSLYSLYLLLASKIADFELGFGKGFALAAWASVPALVSIPLLALQIATGNGQLALDQAEMLSLNYLLVHAKPFTPWAGIASAFKVTDLWFIALCAIGLRAWTGKSLATAGIIAALPYVVIYGFWTAFIVFFKL